MNITTVDIRRAADNMPHLARESVYSPDKNREAYELSLYSRLDRGTLFEYIVAHEIKEATGYDCEVTWQRHPWDITITKPSGRTISVEVKSSVAAPCHGKFLCKSIQSWRADYIIFCIVHPIKGVLINWIEASTVYENTKYIKNQGHCVSFRADGNCSSLRFCLKEMREFFEIL
jgi:hypothetical protein